MKKIGSFNLGLAFAGCFLGAGYVSGQELWQFFGSFGTKGVAGLLVAVALLFFTGIIMILLGRLTKLSEIDKIVVRRDRPLLRGAVTVLELLFLFGVGTIMSAGVGALLEQLFGLAPFIGLGIFGDRTGAVGRDAHIRHHEYMLKRPCSAAVGRRQQSAHELVARRGGELCLL